MKHYTFYHEVAATAPSATGAQFNFFFPIMAVPILKTFRVSVFCGEQGFGNRKMDFISYLSYPLGGPVGEVLNLSQPPGPFTFQNNDGWPVCDSNSPWYGSQVVPPGRLVACIVHFLPPFGTNVEDNSTFAVFASIAIDDGSY
jgi:hypothetical protein